MVGGFQNARPSHWTVIAIGRFYEQQKQAGQPPTDNAKVSLLGATSATIAGASADAADTPKNDWYIWGID